MLANILLLAPANHNIELAIDEIQQLPPLLPSDEATVAFVKDLSRRLLTPDYKAFPELVALGFWLREIVRSPQLNKETTPNVFVKALGLVVHFTPSNVDTMFMYSWICGALLGNKNIVRVATQETDTQVHLIGLINQLFSQPQYAAIAQRNLFVRTDKTSDWSAKLSFVADARVLWGGDDSVQAIRQLPSKPRTRDISFADRYSAAVIHADAVGTPQSCQDVAQKLWKDTLPHMQQACSSPRVVYWVGDTAAQSDFFARVDELAQQQLTPSPTLRNEQLVFSQYSAAVCGAVTLQYRIINVVSCQDVQKLLSLHGGQMTYVLVNVHSLQDIVFTQSEKLQTLTYAGGENSDLQALVMRPEISGIDRVVPVGQALDFAPVWDGMDLFAMLSRRIMIR
ncbi:acyl-CoA reductase [Alteromonas facilis]|uniref:acyl-CoA reductase n=1 Tax=Alteromonas facilis TaxID=2048004 RepID=UPI0013DD3912|nr:acyl-CoA reductase [Alteromonas facilis]